MPPEKYETENVSNTEDISYGSGLINTGYSSDRYQNDRDSGVDEQDTISDTVEENYNREINNTIDQTRDELDTASFISKLDACKEFYKRQSKESKKQGFWLSSNKSGKEKTGYQITATEAKNQLDILEDMEKSFKQVNNPKRYRNQELLKLEREATMRKLIDQVNIIYGKITPFSEYRADLATGNLDNVNIPGFGITIDSIEDARNIASILKNFNKQQRISNEYAADAAQAAIYGQTLQSMENYFEDIINNPSNLYPYQFDANQLAAINYFPELKQAMGKIMPTEQQSNSNNNTSANIENGSQQNPDVQKSFDQQTQKEAVAYTDVKDAFSRGGINGMMDYGLNKTHMNDTQKETWKSIGNLGIMIGAGVVAWKFFKNAFKVFTGKGRKDLAENGGWAWIAGPAALMFGANAWKGESITGLLNGGDLSKGIVDRTSDMAGKGKSAINNAASTVTGAVNSVTESAPAINEGLTGASELFNGLTCTQVSDLLEKDSDGRLKIKSDQYQTLLTTLKQDPNDAKKAAAAKYLEKIGEKDENNMIDITLTSMGLTLEKLKDPANEKITFNEQLAKVSARITYLANLMITKYDHINPEQRQLIIDYVKNPSATEKDLTELEERGDVFEKSEEFPPDAKREEFKNKIDKFTISDSEKNTLKDALNSFWHLWPTDEAMKNKMDITQEGGYIVLTSYGQKTKLDLTNKSLTGFEDGKEKKIRFTSTVELLKAANLVNRTFDLVDEPINKTNISKDPFNISLLGGDIEYDNTKFWSSVSDRYNHKDITIISGGIGGALKKISPALEADKTAFIGLLNKRFNEVNKLN